MNPVSPLIKQALYFAAEAHQGQYRKGGQTPYVAHPVLVSFGVMKYTTEEKSIAAAILHDTLEDCPDISYSLLREKFGQEVADLIEQVSLLEPSTPWSNWLEKKRAYIKKIGSISDKALVIVAVDKMVNMEGYSKAVKANSSVVLKFKAQPQDYLWYYTEVRDILQKRIPRHSVTQDFTELLKQCRSKLN